MFREVRALLARGERVPPASFAERLGLYRRVLTDNIGQGGARMGVAVTRRHARAWFAGFTDGEALRARRMTATTDGECFALLDEYRLGAR